MAYYLKFGAAKKKNMPLDMNVSLNTSLIYHQWTTIISRYQAGNQEKNNYVTLKLLKGGFQKNTVTIFVNMCVSLSS